jgi:hypothetical protein
MSRTSALILIGVIVMLLPFSGLPIAVRSLLNVICGVAVFGIGLSLRTREVEHEVAEMTQPPVPPAIG